MAIDAQNDNAPCRLAADGTSARQNPPVAVPATAKRRAVSFPRVNKSLSDNPSPPAPLPASGARGGGAWIGSKIRRVWLRIGLPACLALSLLLWPEPALAHKMYLFAHRQAETIHGRVYFRGNTPAEGVAIEAFDAAGQRLGQTRTDGQGEFTLPIRSDVEVKLLATTDDGHAAEPFILAPGAQTEQPAVIDLVLDGPEAQPATPEAPQSLPDRPVSAPDRAQLEATVEGAVGRQIAPLRRQLAQWQEEVRDQIEKVQGEMQDQITFRDYVGGIGYILGLMGLAFYFLGARRRDPRVLRPGAENSKPPGQRSSGPGK